MTCPVCGKDHDPEMDEDATKAGVAFAQVVGLVASHSGGEGISPAVLLHVVGLLGGLLQQYSDFDFADILGEIARVLDDEHALTKIHEEMTRMGFAGGLVKKPH